MAHDITKYVIGCREFEVQKINISGEPAEFLGSISLDNHIINKKFSDSGTQTLTNKAMDSFSNQIEADEIHIQIRNESGTTMTKGQLVYISGYNVGLDRTLVTLADASSSSTMPMLAMINDSDIANNASGHATVSGRVFDIDTSAFSVGDDVYVSTTAGEMSTRPTGATDQVQKIGVILRSQSNNGVIQIIGAGRTNDSPNIINIPGSITGDNLLTANFKISNVGPHVKLEQIGAGVIFAYGDWIFFDNVDMQGDFTVTSLNVQNGAIANLNAGSGSLIVDANSQNITLALGGIPTSDPSVAGRLWRDGTDLKISLG